MRIVKLPNSNRIFIIAEAGVNHNGSVEAARELIDAALEAGADAVKFQTFKAGNIASKFVPKAPYQKGIISQSESQLEMLERMELSPEVHKELISYCREKGIIFLSSPFDLESVDLLEKLGLEIFKIPSGEVTNLPYLRKVGRLGKKIILSTGMSTLQEVKDALDLLVDEGTEKESITVLHCNTEYPTPMRDVNLRAMLTIAEAFDVQVGYSDHTLGVEVPVAAVVLGASIIEKHFTLDRSMEGPDHQASSEPHEFKAMVRAIRNIEEALGSGEKKPSASEKKNIDVVRKSIVAAVAIKEGEVFTEENLTVKRAMKKGLSPMLWDEVVGGRAKKDYQPDELI